MIACRLTAFISIALGFAPVWGAPQEERKYTPDDGGPQDHYGVCVAVSGTTALIGSERNDNAGGVDAGAAYLIDTATGLQTGKLIAGDGAGSDLFGYSVALSGAIALVGAPADDDNGNGSGAVYVFDALTGLELRKLLPDDGAELEFFGWSIAFDGSTAVIGAMWDDDNGSHSGSAYLFDVTTGQQLFKLLPGDGSVDARFGWSVALDGTTAIIGSSDDDDNGTKSGSAYLFDITTGQELFKLLPADGAAEDQFGFSVGILGGTAIVGSPFGDNGLLTGGAAYLFDSTTGLQFAKLVASDAQSGDKFGIGVALDGATAVIGASGANDFGLDVGSAYLFDLPTRLEVRKLLPHFAPVRSAFGLCVAIEDEFVVVGAPHLAISSSTPGSAFGYRLRNDFCLGVLCPCGNDNADTGCRNSTGKGGLLVAPAQSSVAADTLQLSASDLPPANLGLFVTSDSVLGSPVQVGDGSICIGGLNSYRFAPTMVGLDGTLTLTNPASSMPPGFFEAGQFRYFQVWTRDVFCSQAPVPCPSPCGGGSNLTNAVEVFFIP